jgi:hypothetical protein
MNTLTPAQIAEAIATLLADVAAQPTTEVAVPTATGSVEVPRDLIIEVVAARAAEAKVKAAKERSEAALKAFLGEATVATVEGVEVFSFAPGVRVGIDTKALKAERPEVAAEFERTTDVRPLLAKPKALASLFGVA